MINAILSLFGDALAATSATRSTPEGFDRLLRGAVAGHADEPVPMGLSVRVPDRDLSRLSPELRARLNRVIARMRDEHGHDVALVEGRRSGARQDYLFGQGRERPGPVVTWTRDSEHESGRAADLIVDGSYADVEAYRTLQRVAGEEGLRTLGLVDPGHVELADEGEAGLTTAAPADTAPSATTPAGTAPANTAAAVAAAAPAAVARVATVARVAAPARPSGTHRRQRPDGGAVRGGAIRSALAGAERLQTAPAPIGTPAPIGALAPGSEAESPPSGSTPARGAAAAAASDGARGPVSAPTPTVTPVDSVVADEATRALDVHYRVTVLHTSTPRATGGEAPVRRAEVRTAGEPVGHGSSGHSQTGGDSAGGDGGSDRRPADSAVRTAAGGGSSESTRAAVAAAGREFGLELRSKARKRPGVEAAGERGTAPSRSGHADRVQGSGPAAQAAPGPTTGGVSARRPVEGPNAAGRVEAVDALRERVETQPLHRVSLRVGEGADATRVRVDLRADQVRADMSTESARLAGRLRQDLPDLTRALERRGLEVETVRVSRGERAAVEVAAPRSVEVPRSAEGGSSSRGDSGGTQRHAQDERSRSRKERNQEGDE